MARKKQVAPLQRVPSSGVIEELPDTPEPKAKSVNGNAGKHAISNESAKSPAAAVATPSSSDQPGLIQLLICVAGIYASLYAIILLLP